MAGAFFFKLSARMSLSVCGKRGCTWLALSCGDSLSSGRPARAFYLQKHGVYVITERLVTVESLYYRNSVTFHPSSDLPKCYKCPDLQRFRGHYISNQLKHVGGHHKKVGYM